MKVRNLENYHLQPLDEHRENIIRSIKWFQVPDIIIQVYEHIQLLIDQDLLVLGIDRINKAKEVKLYTFAQMM